MRRLVVGFAVLVGMAVVGTVVARTGSRDSQAALESAPAATSEPADRDGGRPPAAQPGRDVEAARQAAIDAVGLTDDVVAAGLISRRELIESFTTAEFGPSLAAKTSDQVGQLLVELGARDVDPATLAVIEQPITATVVRESSSKVQVDVWSVLALAAPGSGPGRQVWRTVTVDVAWADGRWLVDGWTSSLGPTPALPPEVPIAPANVLADVIAWAPAGTARAG